MPMPSGQGDGVHFQSDAHAPPQKIQKDRNAVLVIHAFKHAKARGKDPVQHTHGCAAQKFGRIQVDMAIIALALPQASILARVMRSALLDTLDEDYIRTARAHGLTRSQTLWRHALRNALIPVLTIIGLQFSFLLAGAIIIENVFFLPGLGRLVFQGITSRDLIVVKSVVMLLVFAVILVTFLVDVTYALVDPRLRRAAQ